MKQPMERGRGFISYRRDDSDALATLLKGRLEGALPGWHMFLDFGSIPPGTDFKAVLGSALAKSDLLLALIDKGWVGARPSGLSRIHADDDFIHFEVAKALANGLRILPVLVNDARMPSASSLPEDIASITRLNAVEVRISRFEDDFANLVKAVSGRPAQAVRARRWPSEVLGIFVGMLAAAIVGSVGLLVQFRLTGQPLSYWVGGVEAAIVTVAWVVGGGLGARFVLRRSRWA